MGKKKTKGSKQQHLQQSVSSLVSQAALSRLLPYIQQMVQNVGQQISQRIAAQQAENLEGMYLRLLVLEELATQKLGITKEELAERVADLEDTNEELTKSEVVELNDVVRVEIKTKTKDQTEYQGSSRLKLYKTGSGETIGNELEPAILGMKAGESKEIPFGKDKEMQAYVLVNRISRPAKPTEPVAPPVEETPVKEEANAENEG